MVTTLENHRLIKRTPGAGGIAGVLALLAHLHDCRTDIFDAFAITKVRTAFFAG